MLIATLEEPGQHHHNRANHLVFVLLNAEAHGLTRIPPEPYTCDCGAALTPEVLDEGDKSKQSWPNCKSWRKGGKKKCPECDEYPSIGREQYIRARGYEPQPKDDIKNITTNQREEALDRYDGRCVNCGEETSYVKRAVPPRYGGTRDTENLAPLCDHHHDDYGHKFADLFKPAEWYKIHGISWRDVAEEMRDDFEEGGNDLVAEGIDELLQHGEPENPFPYIGERRGHH